jgi:glycosyltransferase involved in cell wall biosynthesis
MKISFGITVCNELKETQRLISQLLLQKHPQDEIVVLLDVSKQVYSLTEYLQKLRYEGKITLQGGYFEQDFSQWKNQLTELCTGDFIFQIDADEYLHEGTIDLIHQILESNPEVDLYYVPRINTVSGITQEHIQRWGWKVENERINWPDYQTRIYRNIPHIKWKNRVHEVIEGYTQYSILPAVDELALIHPKTIERQEKQNTYYESL